MVFGSSVQFMKRQLIFILTTILLFSCGKQNEKGIQVFEGYDFNTGDFKLYGLITEGGSTSFTEKVGDFVVSDTVTLNRIKRDWQIYPTDKRMPCGYSYIIVLMQGDSCVYHFNINMDCEYLTCEKGWYEFPADLMNKYENSVTKVPRDVANAFHDMLISRHTFDK
jgi:hypothetical protein